MKREHLGKSRINFMAREVAWYRRYGKYAARISYTSSGEEYVIGDWSWNRKHPQHHEEIEGRMHAAGVYFTHETSPSGGRLAATDGGGGIRSGRI